MKIVCHRGHWSRKDEQNKLKACLRALQFFDGVEVDLKNKNGKIVLSHDPLKSNQETSSLEALFKKKSPGLYALNIKEDGLGLELRKLISKYQIQNYACFDLSRPEYLKYKELGLRVYDRFGDQDVLPENSKPDGIIFDTFHAEKFPRFLKKLSTLPRVPVMFISPELHQQSPYEAWEGLLRLEQQTSRSFYLCTDLFEEARTFFS